MSALVLLLAACGPQSYRESLAGDYVLHVSGPCGKDTVTCSGGMHIDWEQRAGSDGAFDLCSGNLSGAVRLDLAQTRVAMELDASGTILRVFDARIDGTGITGKVSGGCIDAGEFRATRKQLGSGAGKVLGPSGTQHGEP